MEKNWAFGFCPLLSFTLNVCPGFAVPLHIVLPWTCRALFSVLTYRGIIGRPGCAVYHINLPRAAMAIGWTPTLIFKCSGERTGTFSETK